MSRVPTSATTPSTSSTMNATAVTSTMLVHGDKTKKPRDRARSIGKGADFKYEEAQRLATYTGDAHLTGPQGDMVADKIELYLKPSGDAA